MIDWNKINGGFLAPDRIPMEERNKNEMILELQKETHEKDKEIERLNNIIDTMLEYNIFKDECPLNYGYTAESDEEKAQDVFYEDEWCEKNCDNNYKKCWLKYFERLKALKEGKE